MAKVIIELLDLPGGKVDYTHQIVGCDIKKVKEENYPKSIQLLQTFYSVMDFLGQIGKLKDEEDGDGD